MNKQSTHEAAIVDLDEPVDLNPPPHPEYWVIDEMRSPEAMREGRRPGSVRTLTAAVLIEGGRGKAVATAFQYPDTDKRQGWWHVDIEYYAIKAAGLRPLGLEVGRGFVVDSEAEARDWLHLFGLMTIAAAKSGGAE